MRRSVVLSVFVPILLGLGLSSCSQSSNAADGTKSPATTSSSSAPAKKKPTKSATPKKKPPKKKQHRPRTPPPPVLPQSCSGLISNSAMNRALGKQLPGKTVYIKGVAQRKIERTGRVTCRYGVRAKTIAVEVGISGYTTDEAAINRVAVTIRSEREGGAIITSRTVAGHSVTIMLGAKSGLLVTKDGRRTVAITIDKGFYRGAPGMTLQAVAGTVLNNMPLS